MSEIRFIEGLLTELTPYVRERYATRRTLSVATKSNPTDLLTEVDVEVQQRAQRRLQAAYPNDLFIAEEEGLGLLPDDPDRRCWIMDPIDGTQNFVRGLFPAFGISLAFVQGGAVRAAGVMLPITGDLFLAERGQGASRNGARLRVSEVDRLGHAWIEVDYGTQTKREETLRLSSNVVVRAGAIRCVCAAVVGMCSIATADLDGYVHVGLNPWDYAAALLIVEESGGVASCADGSPLRVFGPRNGVIVSNGRFHEELLAALGRD